MFFSKTYGKTILSLQGTRTSRTWIVLVDGGAGFSGTLNEVQRWLAKRAKLPTEIVETARKWLVTPANEWSRPADSVTEEEARLIRLGAPFTQLVPVPASPVLV